MSGEESKMAYTKGQLAYLGCTIYQQVENGKIVTEDPQGKFFYLKTPISGPGIDDAPLPDGVAEGVEAVPEGAKCWWRQYSQGTLLNGFGYSFGDPQLPTDESSHQFRILKEFEKNLDSVVEKVGTALFGEKTPDKGPFEN